MESTDLPNVPGMVEESVEFLQLELARCRQIKDVEVANLEDKLKTANVEIGHLIETINAYDQSAKIYETNESALMDQIKMLKSRNEDLKQTQDFVSKQIADITEETREIVMESQRLTDVENSLRAQNEELLLESVAVKKENEKLKAALAITPECGPLLTTREFQPQTNQVGNDGELLKEMQEMNSELKRRGEMISELKEKLREYENVTEDLSRRNEYLQKALGDCERKWVERAPDVQNQAWMEKLGEKDAIIGNLEAEIARRDNQDVDTSSIGTVSRTDELNRLRDADDSLEDRYVKLRQLALKMKQKMAEMHKELTVERETSSELKCKLEKAVGRAELTKTLQSEYDRLTDDIEVIRNEAKELKKIIIASDEENKKLKEGMMDVTTLREEVEKLRVDLKSVGAHLEATIVEKTTQETVKMELEREVKLLKRKLEESEQKCDQFSSDLDVARKDTRKRGALMLEIKDFEQSTADLSLELEAAKKKCLEANEKARECTKNNSVLMERIKLLEDRKEELTIANEAADDRMAGLEKEICDYKENVRVRDESLKDVWCSLKSREAEIVALNAEIANLTTANRTLSEEYAREEGRLNKQIRDLKEEIARLTDCVGKRDRTLREIKNEFQEYKIRANSLNKRKVGVVGEEEGKKEAEALKKNAQTLRKQLNSLQKEFESTKMSLSVVESLKERMSKQLADTSEELSRRKKEFEVAIFELKATVAEKETVASTCQMELDRLKIEKQEELEKLRLCLEQVENQKETLEKNMNKYSENLERRNDKSGQNSSMDEGLATAEQIYPQTIVPNGKVDKKTNLLPLDLLLSSNSDFPRYWSESVEESRAQVKTLTSLLKEAEVNVARYEQQTLILKEEIRRLQRMVERQPHVQNTEYLKNIVFKFITLTNADERHHMVPALETILRLSPEETKLLASVAKGSVADAAGWVPFLNWS